MAGSAGTSAYAALAALALDLPPERALTILLQGLVTATKAVCAQFWQPTDRGLIVGLTWPDQTGDGLAAVAVDAVNAVDAITLATLPGVDAVAALQDDDAVYGAITVRMRDAHALTTDDHQWLLDTANCVRQIFRIDRLRAAVSAQAQHTDLLAGELAASRRRLATVRDLERRRVAGEIISLSTERLEQLHQQIGSLQEKLTSLPDPGESAAPLRNLLDELIEDFRVMVRGIQPITLQARGTRAALSEVATGLSRPVRITGQVPARVDHEIGAAIYYLTTTALQTLARTERDHTLEVLLSHDNGRLGVLLTGRSRTPASAVRAALTVDASRLTALGGAVEVSADGADVTVRAWLPDQLEPAVHPPAEQSAALPAQIRALATALAASYGDGPGSSAVQVLLSRIDGPVRIGVQDLSERMSLLRRLGHRFPDLVLLPLDDPADHDEALGETYQRPDAVLRPNDGNLDRIDIVLPGAGPLVRSATWEELPDLLATEIVARAELLRARSLLTALSALLRRVPVAEDAEKFSYQLERLQAGAHEIAELTALAQLRGSLSGLTRSQIRSAERLLGARGTAAHERLGLEATTPAAQLHQAASRQIAFWRRMEQHSPGWSHRTAFNVIVRSCETMLARIQEPEEPD